MTTVQSGKPGTPTQATQNKNIKPDVNVDKDRMEGEGGAMGSSYQKKPDNTKNKS